jgi:SAM-dependent methyltransferase
MDAGSAAVDIKACCAATYESPLVHLLLGGRLHPGGDDLTRRLADLTGIGYGHRILDVASGLGTTARLLAVERGAAVRGIELSPELVAAARRGAVEAGVEDRVGFAIQDAEELDLPAGSFDVVVCECALCTFPDQKAAVAGFRRVLRSGGRVGIADVTLDRDRLPPGLDTPVGRLACIAGALTASGYEALLRDAGFSDVAIEPHPDAALATVDAIRARLESAREWLVGLFDVQRALRLVDLARDAVCDGVIGYGLFTARVDEAAGT